MLGITVEVASVAMPIAGESLLAEALRLPAHERAHLASALLASIDHDNDEPEEVERLWAEESARRVAQLEAGDADLLTWDEVLAEIDASRSSPTTG